MVTVQGVVSERISAFVCQIVRRYPDLRVETRTLNQDGQYNDVLIVNGSLVFRFARVPAAVKTLRIEVTVQRSLHDHLPLSIPNPIYHNLDTDVIGEAFAGYRLLPGKPLWRDAYAAIDDPQALERMATQLAGFLRALHAISVEDTIPAELPRYETLEQWASMYGRIRNNLFPHMRQEAREQVAAHFESFLDSDHGRYDHEPRLRHGDFGTGNIIYDPQRFSIAGIIDFGHVGLGDPACDFAGLLGSYGEAFYARCAEAYPAMAEGMDRVRFFQGTFALEEALFGFDNGDEAAFEAGMARYV